MSISILEQAQKHLNKKRIYSEQDASDSSHDPSLPSGSFTKSTPDTAPSAEKKQYPGPRSFSEEQIKSFITEVKSCFIREVRNIIQTELKGFRDSLFSELGDKDSAVETASGLSHKIEEMLTALDAVSTMSGTNNSGVDEPMAENSNNMNQALSNETGKQDDELLEIIESSQGLDINPEGDAGKHEDNAASGEKDIQGLDIEELLDGDGLLYEETENGSETGSENDEADPGTSRTSAEAEEAAHNETQEDTAAEMHPAEEPLQLQDEEIHEPDSETESPSDTETETPDNIHAEEAMQLQAEEIPDPASETEPPSDTDSEEAIQLQEDEDGGAELFAVEFGEEDSQEEEFGAEDGEMSDKAEDAEDTSGDKEEQRQSYPQEPISRLESFVEEACREIRTVSEFVQSEVSELPVKVAKLVARQMTHNSQSEYLKALNISLSSLHEAVDDLAGKDKSEQLMNELRTLQTKLDSIEKRIPELQT